MRALLICPAERPGVSLLSESAPLALQPVLGKMLIEYWLEHLQARGAREILVLADDRPEQIRIAVEDGARWGARVEVLPESREFTPAEARKKYRGQEGDGWLPAPDDSCLMDRLPGADSLPLFNSYTDWYAAVHASFPRALTEDRIGVRELQPGVWAGLHTHISPQARLHAPCWLGEDVRVEPGAVVGPMAVVEDRSFIASGAEVTSSIVNRDTYVGEWTEVRDSLVSGNILIRWNSDACTRIPDPFLLCCLAPRRPARRLVSVGGRLAAAITMLLGLPLALLVALKAIWDERPVFHPRMAVKPQPDSSSRPVETFVYYELSSTNAWLRRWPQLWNVVRGEFAWVGNRPLNPTEALELVTDFDRLWLAAPVGLISLADAEACADMLGDEARAHATYYAARARWQLDFAILARVLFRTPVWELSLPAAASQLTRAGKAHSREESKSS